MAGFYSAVDSIRHAEDAGEAQRLGRAGKEEMLGHSSHLQGSLQI